MSPQLLGHLVVRVRPLAARKEALLAEETLAAGDRERHHYPVANFELLVVGSDLDDFAHSFMAQDIALFHRRHHAVEQMEIRATDGTGRNLDDGISPVLDRRIRHRLAADVVFAVPSQRLHRVSPSECRRHKRWAEIPFLLPTGCKRNTSLSGGLGL